MNYGGKDYNKKTGDVSTTLENVTVTATKKTSLADKTGALNWANNTGSSKVWREDYWNYKSDGTNTGLNTDKIKMYDHWIQSDKDHRAMSLGAVGIIAAPIIAVGAIETGAAGALYQGGGYLLRKYGGEFAYRTLSKGVENGGDFSQVDFFDVTLSTVNPFRKVPGGNYLTEGVNSLFDFKNGKFQTVLNGKSAKDILIDASFGAMKAKLKTNFSSNKLQDSQIDFMGAAGKQLLKSF